MASGHFCHVVQLVNFWLQLEIDQGSKWLQFVLCSLLFALCLNSSFNYIFSFACLLVLFSCKLNLPTFCPCSFYSWFSEGRAVAENPNFSCFSCCLRHLHANGRREVVGKVVNLLFKEICGKVVQNLPSSRMNQTSDMVVMATNELKCCIPEAWACFEVPLQLF